MSKMSSYTRPSTTGRKVVTHTAENTTITYMDKKDFINQTGNAGPVKLGMTKRAGWKPRSANDNK